MGQLDYTTEKTNQLLKKIDGFPGTVKDGKTPVLETGTTSTLDPGQNATSEVVANGTDDDGNPKYKLNFGIPKGHDGSGGGTAGSVQWADVLGKPSWVSSSTKPAYTASEVGALPSDTQIPSKTSQLTNDSGFVTSSSFKTVNGQSVIGSGNITISGGGSGGGNVNVTNQSSLNMNKYYAFHPSANGSLTGTMRTIPSVTSEYSGLMSSSDKIKIDRFKPVMALPPAVLTLGKDSTEEDITTAFGLSKEEVALLIFYNASVMNGQEYSPEAAIVFAGNTSCLISSEISMEESSVSHAVLYLSYALNGKLRTLGLRADYEYGTETTCSLSCVGSDTVDEYHYLNNNVRTLTNGATKEEIVSAFGGEEEITAAYNAAASGKRLMILYAFGDIGAGLLSSVPVTFYNTGLGLAMMRFSFLNMDGRIVTIAISLSTSLGVSTAEVTEWYPSGYNLGTDIYNLTGDSTSDEIKSALGGENGMRSIINALRAGNTLLINGNPDIFNSSGVQYGVSIPVSVMLYYEKENGDMGINLSAKGLYLWGGEGGNLNLQFTKSTDTFSAEVTSLSV